MKELIKYVATFKFATYWHIEIILIVPFAIWFIWAVHRVISLLEQLVALS